MITYIHNDVKNTPIRDNFQNNLDWTQHDVFYTVIGKALFSVKKFYRPSIG